MQWSRRDGAGLPAGSVTARGRLLLYNIRKSDEGVYVCRAYTDAVQGELLVRLLVDGAY